MLQVFILEENAAKQGMSMFRGVHILTYIEISAARLKEIGFGNHGGTACFHLHITFDL